MTSQSQPSPRCSVYPRLMFRLVPIAVVALFMVMAFPVLARADSLTITFNETSPTNQADVATATLTIGAPDAAQCATCFFIANVDFTSGFSLSGVPSTSLFYDASTGELGGTDSFTFTGQHGGTHDATFTFTDGTPDWQLSNHNVTTGVTVTDSGTYTLTSTAIATPEPSSLLLLGSGLLGLAPALWRRRSGSA